ncbi:hypothetical protein [Agromyces bauzanensis]
MDTATKSAATGKQARVGRPGDLPTSEQLLESLLEKTKRGGIPVRSTFVQLASKDANGKRGSILGKLVTSKAETALDVYLLLHAMASSSSPHQTLKDAKIWARALGLDEGVGDPNKPGSDMKAAKSHLSKSIAKLKKLNLIAAEREDRRYAYELLDESGSGEAYSRPRTRSEGTWFPLPNEYFVDGIFRKLKLPGKAMLLIALSSKPGFTLPQERVPEWYGISRSTAQRGYDELVKAGILDYTVTYRVEPDSPTGWAEERIWHLQGLWTHDARRKSMTRSRIGRTAPSADQMTSQAVPASSGEAAAGESPAEPTVASPVIEPVVAIS